MRRRTFLASSLGWLGALALPAGAATAAGKRLIVVVATGGWDQTFALDPKPPGRIDGPYPDIDPRVPGDREDIVSFGGLGVGINQVKRPNVTAFFQRYADQTTLIRGLWTGSLSHEVSRRRILTGSDDPSRPDIATVSALDWGGPLGVVDLSGTARFGSYPHLGARTGSNGQLLSLLDPSERPPRPDGSPRSGWQPDATDSAAIEAWLADRSAADALARPERAEILATRDDARGRALDLHAEGEALTSILPRGRGLITQAQFAVDILQAGYARAVVVDSGSTWDTHIQNDHQHTAFDLLFMGLTGLAEVLTRADLFDDTVVAVISEFARTPMRNADNGTDHWPYTSALLFGGGVAGGRVCGGSDDDMVGLPVDLETGAVDSKGSLLRYDNFAAGLVEHLGGDREAWFPGIQPLRGFHD